MASFAQAERQPVDALDGRRPISKGRCFSWPILGGFAVAFALAMQPALSMGQANGTPAPPAVYDVELGSNGQWSGRVVDAQGMGVTHLPVRLRSYRGPVFATITDGEGRFAFVAVPTGSALLECDGSPRVCRFWKSGTAPPKSTRQLLVVSQGEVVRGVQGSRAYDWMSDHPVLTYAGIAAMVAVPVAVIASNQDGEPASP